MRRKERQATTQQAFEWLKDCEYAVLCMTGADGRPYGVPISPVLTGSTVYFHCAPAGKKLECIEYEPNVCIVCAEGVVPIPEQFSTAYKSTIAFGTASAVEEETEKIEALQLLCEKYAASNMEHFDREIARSLHLTKIVKIEIEELTGKQKKRPGSEHPA